MFEELGFEKKIRRNNVIYRIKWGFLIPDTEVIFDKKYRTVNADFSLDMQVLQAINAKVKELGWSEL